MSRALLDVNVLIALMDSGHAEHERVHAWASSALTEGWASCAITENGFVRIVTQPRYPSPLATVEAMDLLRASTASTDHAFWPCAVSITSTVDPRAILGPAQLTDAYLLALAVHHDGILVTLDSAITTAAVVDATDRHLLRL